MSEQTLTVLKAEAERILRLLDAMDVDALAAMLTDDAQSVDEITRGWTRGRAAIEAYLEQLRGTVSDVRSRARDLHATSWNDTGIVTFVLEQTYALGGSPQTLEAPTSMVFRRVGDAWKVALIHTMPLPDETDS
jgi:ketosteroid isomerase-like protein